MEEIDLLVSAKWILPIAPQNIVLEDHAIAVNNGRIIAILPETEAATRYQAKQHTKAPNHALMPGLINAHAHTPMNLFRGLADDLNLMDWLQKHIWPAEGDIINETSVTLGSQLAIAEMIRTGTTCFNDHYMFPEATANAVKATGIRASLGLLMMDVPTKWAKNGAEAFDKCKKIVENDERHPRITWAWAPHAPYTTSDETFKKIVDINQSAQLPVHIHLHETAHEINESMQQYGKRPMARLHDLGLLTSQLIAVHMTQINQQDIDMAKATNLHIVHCPESNLKLASGFAPIAAFLKAGQNVALGTDGAASNNDLNLLGEMQTAALLAKAESQDPTSIPATQALEMATINGARALGLDHKIGSLEPGKCADMIAIDLSPYYSQPIYQPISHLVYAAHALQVSDVWVDGQPLLKNGQLTQLDTQTLLDAVTPWIEKAKRYQPKKPATCSIE